ncbi:hypothetical protein C8R45DRAFT_933778 [Mycena sanguinolenta]|nr:hypothetical protein C8R45DRAFT_933778 [Mycena sanguinolenta]
MSDTETIVFSVDLDALSLLSVEDATDIEFEDDTVLDQAPRISVDYATSDTEAESEPLSPGGSLRGLYVRSRPTSLDGSIIEFPTSPSALEPEPALTHFGLTRAPPAAAPIYPHISAHATRLPIGGPMHCVFPAPPTIAPVPVGKRRRYAKSMKGLYTGTGTGTILRHDQAPVVPVRVVPHDFEVGEQRKVQPQPVKEKSRGWRALRKIVPGLFHRPATQHANSVDAQGISVLTPAGLAPTPSPSAASPSTARTRTLSIRSIKSFKSLKSKRKAPAGIENIPPVPALPTFRPRVHSFSGYLLDSELLADEEDETDPEMTAVQLEALLTALKINERYEAQEFGVAM